MGSLQGIVIGPLGDDSTREHIQQQGGEACPMFNPDHSPQLIFLVFLDVNYSKCSQPIAPQSLPIGTSPSHSSFIIALLKVRVPETPCAYSIVVQLVLCFIFYSTGISRTGGGHKKGLMIINTRLAVSR